MNNEWFAFYGSLRRGMSNYATFRNHLLYQAPVLLSGFRMYALADYPYVVKTGNDDDRVVAELFRIIDPSTRNGIHRMELEAGYHWEEVEVEGVKASIYVFPKAGNDMLVKSGDWVRFFGESARHPH